MSLDTHFGSGAADSSNAMPVDLTGLMPPPPPPSAAPLFVDQTDLQKSTALPIAAEFTAEFPRLDASLSPKIAADAAAFKANVTHETLLSFSITTGEITQGILNAWTESVEQQAEASKEAAIRSEQKAQLINDDLLTRQHVKESIAKQPDSDLTTLGSGAFMQYWNFASPTDKIEISNRVNEFLAEPVNSIARQQEDSKKVILPLPAEMIANVMIPQALAMNFADQVALQGVIPAVENSPEINLLMLPVAYASAAAAFALRKLMAAGTAKSDSEIDSDFVTEFAKQMNGRVEGMMNAINDPTRGPFAALAALVGLATIFQFDIKRTANASNLSGEELKSLLRNGYPENETLNASIAYMNKILGSFSASSRVQYVEALLDYINKLPKINLDNLQHFSRILLYATQEIGRDKRIGSEAG